MRRLTEDGAVGPAFLYVAASVVVGLAAAWAGVSAGRVVRAGGATLAGAGTEGPAVEATDFEVPRTTTAVTPIEARAPMARARAATRARRGDARLDGRGRGAMGA